MTLLIWISYFILGIMLVIGISYLGRKYQLGKVDKFIFSLIYLMIVGGVFAGEWKGFNDNLFIVLVISFVVDLVYTTYFLEKDFFDKGAGNIFYYISLIVCGFILNQGFFSQVEVVFPTGEEVRGILWILIIFYLYHFLKERDAFKKINKDDTKKKLDSEYIIISYAKLKYQFMDYLAFDDKELELVVFAIMIFENYKCPAFFRKINNFLFRLDGKARKLGIMQIQSGKSISDVESIEIVYKKLEKLSTGKVKHSMLEVISKYMKEDSEEVSLIYNELSSFLRQ